MQDYYETYWSPEGFCPTDVLTRFVTPLLTRYVSPGLEVLDLGCGDGRTAGLWLSKHAKRYVGVDVSSAALRMAGSLGLNVLRISDSTALPFANETFDASVSIEVLEHLFEPQRVVAEVQRVLRPGGLLFVTVPNIAYWRHRVDFALLGRWDPGGDVFSVPEPWRDPHLRFFTPSTLRAMLERAGFAGVRVEGHAGALLGHLPVIRKLSSQSPDTRFARWLSRLSDSALQQQLQRRAPSLFGLHLHAVARKRGA